MGKVFFIGASKMGTTSISAALKEKGLKVTHTPKYGVYSHLDQPKKDFFEQYDYFLDGNFHNFEHLQRWYPDARFVLLDRDPAPWALSLYNWFSHIDERHMQEEKLMVSLSRKLMNRKVYKRILIGWFVYKKRVLSHFAGSPDFLCINIEKNGKADWARLEDYLGIALDYKWENKQSKKSFPLWIYAVVEDAALAAGQCSIKYPSLSGASGRDRIFLKVMHILAKDFIRERHLVKNLKEACGLYAWYSPKRYAVAARHIAKFIRVIICLVVRVAVVREQRLSPFIY